MQTNNTPREMRFFEYLLELTKLTSMVVRDYRGFEKHWFPNELMEIEGCFVGDECVSEGIFLEIHKPEINKEERLPPSPSSKLKDWLDFNVKNENSTPKYEYQKRYINEHGEESYVAFKEDEDRIHLYNDFLSEWEEWATNLREKNRLSALYNQFFELASRFEREGESIELVFGRGILVWQHPDSKIGLIRSPLITQKLELKLDADEGIITANKVDEINKVEREMFSGVSLPNRARVDELFNQLTNVNINDDKTALFTQLVNTINANGQFIKDADGQFEINDAPVIYDETIFIFRTKNTRVLRDDLENILTQLDSENIKINEAIKSILGEKTERNNGMTDTKADDSSSLNLNRNELFFPLEANEQQKEIVNRIERNFGVTVQGPPGTGKTHTIANLVSHFLTQGKKILITSQKESPLRVLKSKIPKEIQDLCVPVLGGGRESIQEIEKSINTISEKLGELDTEKLRKNVELHLGLLDKSKRKEATLTNQLKEYTQNEGSALKYKDEELFRYDVSKKLANVELDYEWILDEIDMEVEFPLDDFEFKTLWDMRGQLTPSDLKLSLTTLPKIEEDIRSEKSFNDFVEEGEKLSQGKEKGYQQFKLYDLPNDINQLDLMINDLKTALGFKHILENDGYVSMINDLRAGGIREDRWKTLISEMQLNCKQLFELYNALITHNIDLPNKELSEIKENIRIAKERVESGKKANLTFFLLKGKQTKYLFEQSILNGKPLASIEDFKVVEKFIQYVELKNETARIFNGNMNEINESNIEVEEDKFPHILEDRINTLMMVAQVFDLLTALENKLKLNQINIYSSEEIKKVLEDIKQAKIYLQYEKWNHLYQNELSKVKQRVESENNHPIVYQIVQAYEEMNRSQWRILLNQLVSLHEKQKDVVRFYDLLNKFNDKLPLTKKSIEASVGEEWVYPENYLECLELKKLRTWLDQTKDISASKLRKLIENEKKNQRKLIREIVKDATWRSQIAQITDNEKRALSSWKSYIKRFGKGTGKYARQYLNSARETMKNAQSAIPVWIMPTTQVLENFPITNEQFDVIIFDESSQCDIFSANVLLRGKKMIVVGDDQQISPQAIGVKQDDVNDLVKRYLPDVPNSDLFDGNISLYEIAEQTFPKEGKLMLREHFRCVPEIIQFSNDLSYGGQMIPLRLPLESEKLEPPVMAVMVQDGYNDEKDKDINLPEAEAIANGISQLVNDNKFKDQTIGVISLQGNRQHKQLEILIRDKIGDAEYVARKIICGNAYDLQGDERDIVFLSMVVAPNRNFRQLTKLNEKQRFNVAASRAKNQLRLYHSVESSNLNSGDFRYALLSYCKNPTRVNEELQDLQQKCESPFEIDVLKMLLAKGYKVTPQVEVGGYRIDFVIEGLRDRLAIECDGEKWHGPEKFESDMQRQESLERAGWKFWRIRGREFYFDRKKAMESLWVKLDELGIQPNIEESSDCGKEEETIAISSELNKTSEVSRNTSTQNQLGFFEEKVSSKQISMFPNESNKANDEGNKENQTITSVNQDDFIKSFLKSQGVAVIDKRDKGGTLWAVGGVELKSLMNELAKKDIYFKYLSNGSRSTKKQPGWYLKVEN